jgi:L-lactate dehydrogenase complex protein LldG
MDPRDSILDRVRLAIGRKPNQKPLPPPEPLLRISHGTVQARILRFRAALEAVNGVFTDVEDVESVPAALAPILDGRDAVASNHPFLKACGVPSLPGVRSGITDQQDWRNACAAAAVGITSAYCLLADTGSIALLSSPQEPRLLSLLPPVHVAIVHQARLLNNLDEMLSLNPRPVDSSSALVLVTGPSRTGDIEQFLVRGVHGPATVHVLLVRGRNPIL